MAREYGEDRIISAYIDTFEGLRRPLARAGAAVITQGAPRA
jgi:hypothetical protein